MLLLDYEKESCIQNAEPIELNWFSIHCFYVASLIAIERHVPQFNGIIFQLNAFVSVTTSIYYFYWLSYRQDLKRTDFMAFNFILGLHPIPGYVFKSNLHNHIL